MSRSRWKVGIIGATGMVGQRFLSLLENHPWFEVTILAASSRSSGKTYKEALEGRWALPSAMPARFSTMPVMDSAQVKEIADHVDFIFCAVDMPKEEVIQLEEAFAKTETPVVSNNSALRMTPDVPMIIPEINPDHAAVISAQRRRLGTKTGFITVKPNCSIQSYVPALHPLRDFGIEKVSVCTYQALSGAGKTFESWPEMVDNVIPFIKGEEEKSEREPLKIWGEIEEEKIRNASLPLISAQCLRVASSDGHMAAVSVSFQKKPSIAEILDRWTTFEGIPQRRNLPSAPRPFLRYFSEDDRPQTRLDRNEGNGMAVSIGRLRPDSLFDYRFVALSHNTIRGAAGGAVLTAEFLCAEGWIPKKE
ncbi:MAG: aspartate-semialdehyde dehydrogenase [Spirochaetales bacterium]|nr:aspartate-semialdehyde dehydrogenase [Spirochaetales bacterium]